MYGLTQDQLDLRQKIREFVNQEISPIANQLDQQRGFPKEIIRKIGAAGFLDAEFAYIGTGAKFNTLEGTIILEELSRGLPSIGLILSPHYQCTELISSAGSTRLKDQVVAPARMGDKLFAFALSEESGGSDAMGVDTLAFRDGNFWVISGKKCWITNAGVADGYLVTARSPSSGRSRNVSLFYVSKDTPGLSFNINNSMQGLNNSPMGEIIMDSCVIPDYCLIGGESKAYPLIKPLLNEGRLDMAAVAVGISQAAFDLASARSARTGQYGRSLSSYQSISFYLAEMYTKTMMSRNSLYSVASMMAKGTPHSMDVAALKYYATESCVEICEAACRIYGAAGLTTTCEVNRLLRDAQMLTIAEGTSEICKIVISTGIMNSI